MLSYRSTQGFVNLHMREVLLSNSQADEFYISFTMYKISQINKHGKNQANFKMKFYYMYLSNYF